MSLLCSTDTLRGEADCIACDGYVTTGRRLEDAADEIDQLRAENDKLREQGERLFDKTLELATENAKLRELVRDMWEDACNAPCCACCDNSDYDGNGCQLKDRMRELGIEVDK